MKIQRLHLGRYSAVTLLGVAIAFPLLYLISGSLMSFRDIVQYPPRLLPSVLEWDNFVQAWKFLTLRTFGNTLMFVLGILGIQLVVCLPAGFALAKIRFRGSAAVFTGFIIPIFMPTSLILIPTYVVTYQLGLVGSLAGMILPVAGQASVGVLLFRNYFKALPDGLIEAARVDGASWFQTFFRIALPLARPIIASYSVVTFLTAWNLYIWPLIAGGGADGTRVLTVALAPLATTQYTTNSPAIGFAAAVICMVPVLLVFVAFQRWFARGILGTGLE